MVQSGIGCIKNKTNGKKEFLYNQLKAGYATTIAIEHPTRDGDNRHVITGVGMDPSVKSFDDFDLSKVLALDNADGRLKTLAGKKLVYREGGYHIGAPSKSWLNLLKAKGKYGKSLLISDLLEFLIILNIKFSASNMLLFPDALAPLISIKGRILLPFISIV